MQENSVAHETDNFGEIMDIENNNTSIKDDFISIMKEYIKFAVVAVILLFMIGAPLLFLFTTFTRIDKELAATLTGVVVAILIVVIEEKKIHTMDKIAECNRRIIRKIFKFDINGH